MLKRNPHFDTLEASYLFPEIRARAERFRQTHPGRELLPFGIGDVTLPLAPLIVEALQKACIEMGTAATFKGYGPENGYLQLRTRIHEEVYRGKLSPDEIFISDGAKCDIARLFACIDPTASCGLQTPCYPAFADAWKLLRGDKNLHFLPCDPLTATPLEPEKIDVDLLVIANPNNPTGHLMEITCLKKMIQHAASRGQILLYDSAYHSFIQDSSYPYSVYEIEGAKECVIEIGSFSKSSGFTGIRLGWCAIPKELIYRKEKLQLSSDYRRLIQTLFNGASYISQMAGLAALSKEGGEQLQSQRKEYLKRAALLSKALSSWNWQVAGGCHSPFIWTRPPSGSTQATSWEIFDALLEQMGWITTPGSGFGPQGEGWIRLSAFAHAAHIERAAQQIQQAGSFQI